MHLSESILLACLAASATAHGVVTSIEGANGVTMPGLSSESILLLGPICAAPS